jgi:threonine dehydratase
VPVHDAVTIGDIQRAAETLRGHVVETPSRRSRTLSEITGAEVVLKFENLQFTASFKERGARVKLESLSAEARAAGVVAMSAGNHAQAVAHHAALLGVHATIVMPADTPLIKVTRTEHLGARVVLHGDDLAHAAAEAHRLADVEGLTFVPPYDDPDIIAGQGTVGLEFLTAVPDLDVLLVPVGGGGLIAGISVAAAEVAPTCAVVGVESELHSAVGQALGRPTPLPEAQWGPTIAEGIAVPHPGTLPLAIIAERVDDVITATEARIEEAVALFLEIEKVVVEGAGAAGLAALLQYPERFAGKRVGLVLTGGNIDLRLLSSVILRGLVRTGRLSRLNVEVSDRPGSLGRLTAAVGHAGANIVEVTHQRAFATHSARLTEIELVVETRDAAHADRVVEHLRGDGFTVEVIRT